MNLERETTITEHRLTRAYAVNDRVAIATLEARLARLKSLTEARIAA